MGAKVLGNHGPYFMNGITGSGTRNIADGSIGWNQIMGKAGDWVVLGASEIHSRDQVQRGYFFQGDGNAAATIEMTLANEGTAKDPTMQSVVPWVSASTLGATMTNVPASLSGTNIYWHLG